MQNNVRPVFTAPIGCSQLLFSVIYTLNDFAIGDSNVL